MLTVVTGASQYLAVIKMGKNVYKHILNGNLFTLKTCRISQCLLSNYMRHIKPALHIPKISQNNLRENFNENILSNFGPKITPVDLHMLKDSVL